MNWSSGYSAAFYLRTVDSATWRGTDRIEVTGGNISRSLSDLQESADLECINYENQAEQWIRVWMDVRQNGDAAHVPLFTGLAVSPDQDIDGTLRKNTVQCYSVLKPAQDVLLPRGWFAGEGMNGGELVRQLLSVTPAPKTVTGIAPDLSQNIIAENGESYLSMARKILDAMNWRLRIGGDGVIEICPRANEISADFNSLTADSLNPSVRMSSDWFECPNVFRAVKGDEYEVVRDDDPDSMLSTITRGREVWMEDTGCHLNNGESLYAYAVRRLREEQQVAVSVSYDRRYHPDVMVGDRVRLRYPAQKIKGVFRVVSQKVTLGYGAMTAEEVEADG